MYGFSTGSDDWGNHFPELLSLWITYPIMSMTLSYYLSMGLASHPLSWLGHDSVLYKHFVTSSTSLVICLLHTNMSECRGSKCMGDWLTGWLKNQSFMPVEWLMHRNDISRILLPCWSLVDHSELYGVLPLWRMSVPAACKMNVHKRCKGNVANTCGIDTKQMGEVLAAMGQSADKLSSRRSSARSNSLTPSPSSVSCKAQCLKLVFLLTLSQIHSSNLLSLRNGS